MKVLLRSDIAGVGRRGDIITVSSGHARNHLLPHGLAIVASEGEVVQAGVMRRARDLRENTEREAARGGLAGGGAGGQSVIHFEERRGMVVRKILGRIGGDLASSWRSNSRRSESKLAAFVKRPAGTANSGGGVLP